MSALIITILAIIVAVFAVAVRMDVKRRHLEDTSSGATMSRAARRLRVQGHEKGSESGLGL